jgi:hypothetical protein
MLTENRCFPCRGTYVHSFLLVHYLVLHFDGVRRGNSSVLDTIVACNFYYQFIYLYRKYVPLFLLLVLISCTIFQRISCLLLVLVLLLPIHSILFFVCLVLHIFVSLLHSFICHYLHLIHQTIPILTLAILLTHSLTLFSSLSFFL